MKRTSLPEAFFVNGTLAAALALAMVAGGLRAGGTQVYPKSLTYTCGIEVNIHTDFIDVGGGRGNALAVQCCDKLFLYPAMTPVGGYSMDHLGNCYCPNSVSLCAEYEYKVAAYLHVGLTNGGSEWLFVGVSDVATYHVPSIEITQEKAGYTCGVQGDLKVTAIQGVVHLSPHTSLLQFDPVLGHDVEVCSGDGELPDLTHCVIKEGVPVKVSITAEGCGCLDKKALDAIRPKIKRKKPDSDAPEDCDPAGGPKKQ